MAGGRGVYGDTIGDCELVLLSSDCTGVEASMSMSDCVLRICESCSCESSDLVGVFVIGFVRFLN